MQEFDAPSYSGDTEITIGFPPGAHELRRRLEASDAFVIVSPEYNFSIPGLLKNAIDWVPRFHPQPLNERVGLFLAAMHLASFGRERIHTRARRECQAVNREPG